MDDKIIIECAKEVYEDVGRPVAKPTGEILSLLPRAIKAALAPVEKWVLQREYNIKETRKLLEDKLQNILPEQIESPEPYVAVPALQSISYCMNNDELRNMYANLLANSMIKTIKNGVHPGFVEIIKQLCPDEAKILKCFSIRKTFPTITLRLDNKDGEGFTLYDKFSSVGEIANCEKPYDVNKYFDNLIRLGLLKSSSPLSTLTDKSLYEPLKNNSYVQSMLNSAVIKHTGVLKNSFIEGYISLTDYGISFCKVCILEVENHDQL